MSPPNLLMLGGEVVGAPFMRPRHFFFLVPCNFLSTNSRTKSEPKFCVIRAFSMELSIFTFFLSLIADRPKQFVYKSPTCAPINSLKEKTLNSYCKSLLNKYRIPVMSKILYSNLIGGSKKRGWSVHHFWKDVIQKQFTGAPFIQPCFPSKTTVCGACM